MPKINVMHAYLDARKIAERTNAAAHAAWDAGDRAAAAVALALAMEAEAALDAARAAVKAAWTAPDDAE